MIMNEACVKWYTSLILALLFLFFSTFCFSATINVPADFVSIQLAVNAATPGDIVLVDDGVYNEHVIVDKKIVIKSVNGYGTTTVTGPWTGVFKIMADEVTIDGFTTYAGSTPSWDEVGIYLTPGTVNCTIVNNRCGYDISHKHGIGIWIEQSHNNTVSGNICGENEYEGILLSVANNNNISRNSCNNNRDGITLNSSEKNTILNNNCNLNDKYYGDGIILTFSNDNNITGNTCTGNPGYGICLVTSAMNTISRNNCSENNTGIQLRYSSDNNNFINNVFSVNVERGIYLYQNCANNTFANNTSSENAHGLSLINSNDNIFYLNNFINNTQYTIGSNGVNIWRSPGKVTYAYNFTQMNYLGNFYSDHDLTDSDMDGITDNPYNIGASEPDDDYALAENAGNYSIIVVPELAGDSDKDGDVDAEDLVKFAENFGN